MVRRVVLIHNVFMEPRAIVDTENSADCACHGTNRSSYYCSDGTSLPVAYRGTVLRTTNRALGLNGYRKRNRRN
jgi:hypothetical protein